MELTRFCLILIAAVAGATFAQGRILEESKDDTYFPSTAEDSDDGTEKRSLKFEIPSTKAKAFQRRFLRGFKWGGNNKQEECREGCSKEELGEHGMNKTQIIDYMRFYNCKYKVKCNYNAGYICTRTNNDWSHNKRLLVNCHRDGAWSSWSSFSSCTKSCGSGTRYRTRTCTNPSRDGGRDCIGSSRHVQYCNTKPCPVNGGWSTFSNWTPCTKSCGGGIQTKTRKCNRPTPRYGGRSCSGSATDKRSCNTNSCAVNGGWSGWSEYTACSKSCGGGLKTRTRSCTNPAPKNGGRACAGSVTESSQCNIDPCPVDGGWSAFTEWSPCTESCGGGKQKRGRICDSPEPAYGGKQCDGLPVQQRDCNTNPCPVDGGWSDWSAFSVCSASCGAGKQSRTRTCNNPAPAYGGEECFGESTEEQDCNEKECPVDGGWAEWSEWTDCSVSCGSGFQGRRRNCSMPAPQYGGKECEGERSERRQCNEAPCESADLEQGMTDSNVESETCHLSYLRVESQHAKGGVAAPDEYQDSIENCQKICSDVVNCMGYDWDEGDNPWKGIRCWLKNVEFSAIDGVDYYQKRDWNAEEVSGYMKYLNYHGEGAKGFPEMTTVSNCAKKCLGLKGCLAFDFDHTDSPWKETRCWCHMNELESWNAGNHFLKIPCAIKHEAVAAADP